jgi:hypothetical protein
VELADEGGVLFRDGPADGVGNVHGSGAGGDDGFADFDEEFGLGARGVFGGEFDVVCVAFGLLHAVDGEAEDFVLGFVEFVFAMDFGGGEEDVDTAEFAVGGFDGFTGGVDVLRHATGEAGDLGAFDFAGDFVDGFEIALTGDGEAGFNDVDLEASQLPSDFELFAKVHGRSRALLAIAQGCVEDYDPIIFHIT